MIKSSPLPSAPVPGASVLSTNVAVPLPCPTGEDRLTGIHKVAQSSIEVFTPGPTYGDGSGVAGDLIGDTKHHGGEHKAVYAFAREELDYWGGQLGEDFANGHFGENLTTAGVVWSDVLLNQQIRVGSALLEVSVPRSPCRTFASWLDQRGWVKTFTARGDAGAYLRVVTAGSIHPGDSLEFLAPPAHSATMGDAFAAAMGNKEAARKVARAHCYPPFYQARVEKLAGLV